MQNLVPIEATVDSPRRRPATCPRRRLPRDLAPVTCSNSSRAARWLLVEFRTEDRYVPIKPEHKMTKAQVVREMAANGFERRERPTRCVATRWRSAPLPNLPVEPARLVEASSPRPAGSTLIEPYLVGGGLVSRSGRSSGGMRGMGAPLGEECVPSAPSPRARSWRAWSRGARARLPHRARLVLGVDAEGRWQVGPGGPRRRSSGAMVRTGRSSR